MATMTGVAGAPTRAAPSEAARDAGMATPAIADPAPLGLAAFGLTTLMLSVVNANWLGAQDEAAVMAMAIPLGGGAQILAGMWAYRRGSTFAATAFTAYGAFWLSFYLLVQFFLGPLKAAAPGGAAGAADSANATVGLYLFCWTIFTAYMLLASLGGARAVSAVFFFLTLTFAALTIGKWGNSVDWTHIGGYLGLITAAAALYTSFADVTNANFKRIILPT